MLLSASSYLTGRTLSAESTFPKSLVGVTGDSLHFFLHLSLAFWTENLSQTHVLGKASIRDFLTQDVQMAPSDRFPLGRFGSTD